MCSLSRFSILVVPSLRLPLLSLISIILANKYQFLNSVDFFNANFVNTNEPLRISANDQRFPLKRKKRGSAVIFENDKWPNGRIPYVISSTYTLYQRAIIARAISAYATRTCIRFTPRQLYDRDYIIISKTDGCFADFAHVGGGPQQVSLADECLNYATVIHELMHVIGFIHEHQRNDRDHFVNILWQNIIPGANTDFEKLTSVKLSYYGERYDYFSIMHYESTEGSRNGKNTVEAKIQEITPLMGKSSDFSSSDINRINRAYKC
ncbi:zinc metalloproteinase nas-1 [Wuchereria bancrofti]|uniref:Metalloendopeptidase n=1 Tax=Wuchereria bancrofti TaxID=6293 RepID=J9F6A9_WUCBA|nr:zinc metalloproteinase nas-1 [Wuchereria bancrofti]